ncbi:hemolysin D [Photobacterium aquae]|uniref:Hemolysin D n=1 Tax=Photobacterium aquae TaxID=1195763 RepID=A0A0J1GVP0_9GAMM|nr:efflux RND transporter periplasmic adaptor subunit [Photobacterium aquae]KLV03706.1 hemolysin D [Photobacterium aquae]
MNAFTQCAIAIAIAPLLVGCNQQQTAPKSPSPASRPLEVIELKSATSYSNKHFSGIVHAKDSAALAFRVPGTVQQLLVKKGDKVQKGDVVARLDPHDYQVVLDELNAKMLEAQSAHKLANAELRRVRQATQDDAIAKVNLDRAISGYERSLSAIKVVEKNIQRATDALRYTELRAPFSGIMGHINIEAHEQILSGAPVLILQDTSILDVDIDVPENLIEHFSLGQKAAINWYNATRPIPASVSEIAAQPHPIKQTYTVTLAVAETNDSLFSGKAVTVSTALNHHSNAYCLPYSALVGSKAELHINRIRDSLIVRTPVSLQAVDAYQACVYGELQEGDYVVVSGSHYLKDGDPATQLQVRQD